jgi:hypothetical protein
MKLQTVLRFAGCALAPFVVCVLFGGTLAAQENGKEKGKEPEKAAAPTSPTPAAKPKLTQAELEAAFKATLTKATLVGRWSALNGGKLSPEKEDKYTIVSVTKLGGEAWLIHARIQYGNKDFVAPVPVQVKWAGDTPVITLDDVGIPGSQSFSARVLIYNKTYAGTWSGGGHAGLMNGLVVNDGSEAK